MSGETNDGKPNDTLDQQVQEGAGLKDFSIGMTLKQLTQKHGVPQPNHPDWLMRWDARPFMDVIISEEGICREVRFNQGFEEKTTAGITIGSSFEDARIAYGAAEQVWTRNSCVVAEWPSKGIALWTMNSKVTQIIVREPREPSPPRFKNDPQVLGSWKSVDCVATTEQFNPAKTSWQGDLFLKELTFLPDGKSPAHWSWTKNMILNEDSWSLYELKQIEGETYLFLEWMSGDVTIRGEYPLYYVFKRASPRTAARSGEKSLLVQPSVAIEKLNPRKSGGKS